MQNSISQFEAYHIAALGATDATEMIDYIKQLVGIVNALKDADLGRYELNLLSGSLQELVERVKELRQTSEGQKADPEFKNLLALLIVLVEGGTGLEKKYFDKKYAQLMRAKEALQEMNEKPKLETVPEE